MQIKNEEQLIELLLNGDFMDRASVNEVQKEAKTSKKNVADLILEKGLMNKEEIGQLIAEVNNWNFVSLNKEGVNVSIMNLIPLGVAEKHEAIAFDEDDYTVKIAMTNPEDMSFIHMLEKKAHKNVEAYFAIKDDITSQYSLYKSDMSEQLQKIIISQTKAAKKDEEKTGATIQIVDMLITNGYDRDASDIHIEPFEEYTLVRFRVDGLLQDVVKIPADFHAHLISRIKVIAHLRTDEHQTPQDGKIHFKMTNEEIDIRVSIVPTTDGENVVMRILSDRAASYTLEDIGMLKSDLVRFEKIIKKPWGMILATGPTGSGKTTSLYAMLKILNQKHVNTSTIEDPVEYNIEGITQIQVNPKADLTFASGLRSIVRQDPDIIMVGEIRDNETASIAINSAMTGHVVLSTLHTNDAATTLPRLLDMGIEPFLVASTVNVVVAQRLVRKICSRCITSYEGNYEKLSEQMPLSILEELARGKDKITLYKGTGCKKCNQTGYSGRTGVFEILEMDTEIRRMVTSNSDADAIKQKAISKGMVTMFEDTKEKVLNGVTTIDELIRVVKM